MHPDVATLLQIQRVDQALAKIRRDLDSIPKERIRREAALEAQRAAHRALAERRTATEVAARNNELSIKGSDEEIRKLEGRLNTVKNNAEYQATLLQIESVRRERARIEEEGLALLESVEGLESEVAASQAKLAAEEEVFAEFVQKGEAFLAEKSGEVDRVGAGRAELVAKVPPDLMARYERIFSARDGFAVCALEGETCTGCYTSIPPNLQVKLQAGTAVVQCNSCQRILFVPD